MQGWYHKGEDAMYVMRGIGTTPGIPFRMGVRPEVLVLDLIPAEGISRKAQGLELEVLGWRQDNERVHIPV